MCKGVYLLCFADNPVAHAKHYLGYADDVSRRVAEHRNGTGSKLTRALIDAGGDFIVSWVWEDADRDFEAKLKHRTRRWDAANGCFRSRGTNVGRYCPTCATRTRTRNQPRQLALV